jgi:hypothetical protein
VLEIGLIGLSLWLLIDNVRYAMKLELEIGEVAYRAALMAALAVFCSFVFIKKHLDMRKVRASEIFSRMQQKRAEQSNKQ